MKVGNPPQADLRSGLPSVRFDPLNGIGTVTIAAPPIFLCHDHIYCIDNKLNFMISSQHLDRFTRPAEPVSGGSTIAAIWEFLHQKQRRTAEEQRAVPWLLPAPHRRRSGVAAENDMSITDNVQKTAKTARCGLLDRAVRPGDIIVGDRLRALDRDSVERLKESISRIGLKTPISVRSSEQGWRLVSGRHRLEACSELGMDEIPVVVETVSELGARLWEIAENLHRAELTALERAEHISQWIRLRGERGEGKPCDRADDKLDQVGPVSGFTELLKWRSSRRRADAVAKAAFVPPPVNSASREPMRGARFTASIASHRVCGTRCATAER